MSLDLSRFEPLLPDSRVEQLAHKIRSQFGHARFIEAQFITFVQPAKDVVRSGVRTWIPEMAVFAIISPNPRPAARILGQSVMTHGTVALEDWRASEKDASHFVSAGTDSAHEIFRGVAREHLRVLTNLREMI